MSTLRAILVEDEPTGMENLRWKLQQHCPEVEIVAECESGEKAIAAIKRHMPDVLFLDILLGDMTGFDILKAIRHPSFEVIFTTSYDEYAIEAIKNSALYYLLKPIEVDELLEAVAKARAKLRYQPSSPSPIPPQQNKLGFPVSTGQQFIELQRIVYAEAEDNVAILHLEDKKTIKITKSLGWVETQLQEHGFCRIHHSFVISFNHLKEYIRNEGGYLIMSTGKALSLSRRRKDHFLSQLEQWKLIS
ncbi:MAG: LytTR family DNA-binding domain-containing protein [Bacteroidota bacterium]